MDGLRTILVLGAGASYCYEDGSSNIPIQSDLVGRLFLGHDATNSQGVPTVVGPDGLTHSYALGQFLRTHFDLPEDPNKKNSKLDFWTSLQNWSEPLK